MNIFEGTHIKLDLKTYPNSVFFFKEDKFWMEYNWKTKDLWCRWEGFWRVLGMENRWNYSEVQAFIKSQVEEHFKLKGITPGKIFPQTDFKVEEHFKLKGITPERRIVAFSKGVEEHFKVKTIKRCSKKNVEV